MTADYGTICGDVMRKMREKAKMWMQGFELGTTVTTETESVSSLLHPYAADDVWTCNLTNELSQGMLQPQIKQQVWISMM